MTSTDNNEYFLVISGEELLEGKRQDAHIFSITNSLKKIGLFCRQCIVTGDRMKEVTEIISHAFEKVPVILMTGGLGPTVDDITREALSTAMNIELHEDPGALQMIEDRFKSMGRTMSENNKCQALVPVDGFFIKNPNGTAPGLVFDNGQKIAIALPGPPRELVPMIQNEVVPYLSKRFSGLKTHLSRMIRFCCLGESTIDSIVRKQTEHDDDISISSLSRIGLVDLTLSYPSDEPEYREQLERYVRHLRSKVGSYIFTEDEHELEDVVGSLLKDKNHTLAVAESCTGGLLGAQITAISGSSTYFAGGIIAYTNQIKEKLLNVGAKSIDTHGAVSKAVAVEMAHGIIKHFHSDWGISITGIAGPEGGTPNKPVGTVWICVSNKDGSSYPFKVQLPPGRSSVRQRSVIFALDQLRRLLVGIQPHNKE